jgi:hypothetical protein
MKLKRTMTFISGIIILLLLYWLVQQIYLHKTRVVSVNTDIPVSVSIARKQKLVTTFSLSGMVDPAQGNLKTLNQNLTTGLKPADNFTVRINANVTEREVFKLKTGDEVKISTGIYPGYIFTGHITKVATRAGVARTYPIEILVPYSAEYSLENVKSVQVSFNSFTPDEALTIPRSALLGTVKHAKVFRIKKGVANLRIVIIGRQSSEFLEVLNGISRGDTIVVSGQNNLVEGTRVNIVN